MNRIFGLNLILFVTGRRDKWCPDHSGNNLSLANIVFKDDSPTIEFLSTYIISVISASLGLAKCLKNGVARPIAPGGSLRGYLTGKFLLGFVASAVGLVTRGTSIFFTVHDGSHKVIIKIFFTKFLINHPSAFSDPLH